MRLSLLQLCQPVLQDGSSCKDAFNAGRYIEEFTCAAAEMTAKRFKDMRLSFPSGHASFACYSMVYLVVRGSCPQLHMFPFPNLCLFSLRSIYSVACTGLVCVCCATCSSSCCSCSPGTRR